MAGIRDRPVSARNGDFDANGIVDFGDFILFAQAFGSNQSQFDLDGSKSVDFRGFHPLCASASGEGAPETEIRVTLPGGAKLEMVWIHTWKIPDGVAGFRARPGRVHEGPRHEVTITTGFYMGKHEVTQSQWESVMNTRPWLMGVVSQVPGKENFPANRMRWREIETFIRELNEAEGSDIFRLPTEAEVGIRMQGRHQDALVVRKRHDPYRRLRAIFRELTRRYHSGRREESLWTSGGAGNRGRFSEPVGPI